MSAQPAEPTLAAPAAPAAPAEPSTAVTTPPAPAPADPATTGDPAPATNPWDDPAAAKAEIERLRRENGSARTNAKAQAAEDAKKELAQTIGRALGLVEDEAIDPAKLTESLTTAQADAKKAQVALAVFQNAGTVGDPLALLDSTSFLTSLAGIDPNDSAAITAAIASAVAANPRLGAASTDPRTPAPNPAQGASAGGAPDLDSQIAEAQKAGNTSLAIHLQNQKLITATPR
jgi:hypothetical protein